VAVVVSAALWGCGEEVSDEDGGGLLVPDQPQEAKWGTLGSAEESTAEQEREEVVEGGEEADNSGARPSCAEGGVLWRETSSGCGSPIEDEQFQLLNADRVAQGLSPLRCHFGLLDTARRHNEDMSERAFFDHVNPDGERPWDRMEANGVCGWVQAGENIASGQTTPAQVEEDWMNSPGHRANILSDGFTHVGVGYFHDGRTTYWTQVFATF
jgi:uncharacterized protein YkwD